MIQAQTKDTPALPSDRLIYTECETSILLRVSQPTLQRIRYRGEIAFLKIGAHIRYSRLHIDQYLVSIECPVKTAE